MDIRNKSGSGDSGYEVARLRVKLYGEDGANAMLDRYCKIAARLQQNCSAMSACLQREAKDSIQRTIRGSPYQVQANNSSGNLRFGRSNAQLDLYARRTTSNIDEIVREVVDAFGPTIIELAWTAFQRAKQQGANVPQAAVHFQDQNRKTQPHQYGQRYFDESEHPRAPAGLAIGGQFVAKNAIPQSGVGKNEVKRPDARPQAEERGLSNEIWQPSGGFSVARRGQSGRGPARLSQTSKRHNITSKHVYTQRSGTVYVNNGWWDTLLGDRFDEQISRPVDDSKYRISIETINKYVDEYWDFVKDWGAEEWNQYFRIFGTPAPKAFQEINRGAAQRIELNEVARPGLRREDIRFYQGMSVFAGAGKFVEVGYPVIMTEVFAAIFFEPIIGAVVEVTIEAGAVLVVRQGNRVIRVAGKKLDDVIEFLTRSGKVKKNPELKEVSDALQKVLDEATEKITPPKIPKVGSAHPDLPVRKYDSDPTHGIFNDKKSLMSGPVGGDALEVFRDRIPHLTEDAIISLKHVEGHSAAEMAKNGLTEAVVHINYKTGPCPRCVNGIQELLAEGQKLWVVFPDGVGYFTNKGWTPK